MPILRILSANNKRIVLLCLITLSYLNPFHGILQDFPQNGCRKTSTDSVWPCIWEKEKKTCLDLSTCNLCWIMGAELCCWEGLRENDHSVSSLFVLDRGDKHSHPVSVFAGLKITLEWELNHSRKASCSHGTENGDGPVSYSLSESALLNHSPGNA